MTHSSLARLMISISFVGLAICSTALAAPLTDAYYFFDNTDTPTTALDSTGNGYTFPYLTGTPNATQTTAQAKFGTGSMLTSSAGGGFGS